MKVLDDIPVNLSVGDVLKNMRMRNTNASVEQDIQELLDAALPFAKPKALYKVAYVENKGQDSVEIDGVSFKSPLLRKNLDKVGVQGRCNGIIDEG